MLQEGPNSLNLRLLKIKEWSQPLGKGNPGEADKKMYPPCWEHPSGLPAICLDIWKPTSNAGLSSHVHFKMSWPWGFCWSRIGARHRQTSDQDVQGLALWQFWQRCKLSFLLSLTELPSAHVRYLQGYWQDIGILTISPIELKFQIVVLKRFSSKHGNRFCPQLFLVPFMEDLFDS